MIKHEISYRELKRILEKKEEARRIKKQILKVFPEMAGFIRLPKNT